MVMTGVWPPNVYFRSECLGMYRTVPGAAPRADPAARPQAKAAAIRTRTSGRTLFMPTSFPPRRMPAARSEEKAQAGVGPLLQAGHADLLDPAPAMEALVI